LAIFNFAVVEIEFIDDGTAKDPLAFIPEVLRHERVEYVALLFFDAMILSSHLIDSCIIELTFINTIQ
jgi:hypothetical protein